MNLERSGIVAAVIWVSACTPPAQTSRRPEADELRTLQQSLHQPSQGWSGRGYARIESPQGPFEGDVELRVDPPRRARLELRGKAAFGLVSDGFVIVLPGDDHVVTWHKRSDTLERAPFSDSIFGRYTPNGTLADLFAWVAGQPPWPGGAGPQDLPERARLLASEDGGRTLSFRIELLDGAGQLEVRLESGELRACAWWRGGERQLEVRYDRWAAVGAVRLPGRLELRVPREELEAEIWFDERVPRGDFETTDFQVY